MDIITVTRAQIQKRLDDLAADDRATAVQIEQLTAKRNMLAGARLELTDLAAGRLMTDELAAAQGSASDPTAAPQPLHRRRKSR